MRKLLTYIAIGFICFSVSTAVVIWQVEKASLHDSIIITCMLFGAGEPLTLDISNIAWITGVMIVGQTLLGLATLTLAFGILADYLMSEKIARLMRREKIKMKDHVIVCGLGDVGYHVVEELQRLRQPVVIIDRGDEKNHLDMARKAGHKVIVDNLKDESTLDLAELSTAKSIIICTGDDLINMDVALNARQKRPDVIIVMRMSDEDLAKKIAGAFDIKVAFSAEALSAPVFAAASFDRTVFQTVKLERELFVSARLDVGAGSGIIGMTVAQLLQKSLTVLKLISGEERIKFPKGDRVIQAGDRLYVTCTIDTLYELKLLNERTSPALVS